MDSIIRKSVLHGTKISEPILIDGAAALSAIVTAVPLYFTLMMVPFKFVDFPARITGTFAADTGLLRTNNPHRSKNVNSVFYVSIIKLLSQ